MIAPGFDRTARRLPLALLLSSSREATQIADLVQGAVNAWSQTRAISPELPELLVTTCKAADSTAIAFLGEGTIPAVIAATKAVELESVVALVEGRAVVFAPFAESPKLLSSATAKSYSVVSCKPNRAESVVPMLEAVSAVRQALEQSGRVAADPRTVVALSRREVRFGYAEALSDAIVAEDNIELVTYDEHLGGKGLMSELEKLPTLPDLIVGISGEEDWSQNIEVTESNYLSTGSPRPSYVLTDRDESVLYTVRNVPPPITPQAPLDPDPLRDRVVFWDQRSDARYVEVQNELAGLLGIHSTPLPALSSVYDCFYVAAYAFLSAQSKFALSLPSRVTAENIVLALPALVGGEALPIGHHNLAKGRATLAQHAWSDGAHGLRQQFEETPPLDLVGGSGDLDLVPSASADAAHGHLTPRVGVGELYCIDTNVNGYCATGVTSSESGTLEGESQCPCLKFH